MRSYPFTHSKSHSNSLWWSSNTLSPVKPALLNAGLALSLSVERNQAPAMKWGKNEKDQCTGKNNVLCFLELLQVSRFTQTIPDAREQSPSTCKWKINGQNSIPSAQSKASPGASGPSELAPVNRISIGQDSCYRRQAFTSVQRDYRIREVISDLCTKHLHGHRGKRYSSQVLQSSSASPGCLLLLLSSTGVCLCPFGNLSLTWVCRKAL